MTACDTSDSLLTTCCESFISFINARTLDAKSPSGGLNAPSDRPGGRPRPRFKPALPDLRDLLACLFWPNLDRCPSGTGGLSTVACDCDTFKCSHAGAAAGGGELDGAVGAVCTGTTTAVVGITKAGCNETATALEDGLLGAGWVGTGLVWWVSFGGAGGYTLGLGLVAGTGADTEWTILPSASAWHVGGPCDGCSGRSISICSCGCEDCCGCACVSRDCTLCCCVNSRGGGSGCCGSSGCCCGCDSCCLGERGAWRCCSCAAPPMPRVRRPTAGLSDFLGLKLARVPTEGGPSIS